LQKGYPPHILTHALTAAILSSPALADTTNDFLPAAPPGKEWKLAWHDEFEGTQLDESKWNRLGDWKRRDGFWIKDDAFLNGQGQLILRTRTDASAQPPRFTCGAVNTRGKFEYIKLTEEIGKWGGEIREAQLPDTFEVDYVRVYDLVEKPEISAK
jgi:beta-glucanase (GH16 family)